MVKTNRTAAVTAVIIAALIVALAGWPSGAEAMAATPSSSVGAAMLTPTPGPTVPAIIPPPRPTSIPVVTPEAPDYDQLRAELDAAIELWESNADRDTQNYSMTTQMICFCPPESVNNTTTVINGQATFTNPASTGYTVDSIFASIRRAIDSEPFRISASYDANGAPISLFSGEDPTIIADAFGGVIVSDFTFQSGSRPDYAALQRDLDAARLAWELNGDATSNYTMDTTVSCFCPPASFDNTTAVVDGVASFSNPDAIGYTVEGLFDEIENAIDRRYNTIRVEYNPDGVPISVYREVGPIGPAVDDFFGITVTSFIFDNGAGGEQLPALIEAKAKWEAAFGADDYAFEYRQSCECPDPVTVPQTVWVNSDDAVLLQISQDGVINDPRTTPITIEDLFGVIGDAIADDAHQISVEYQPVDGYPQSVFIDYDPQIADEEFSVELISLTYPDAFVPLLADAIATLDEYDVPAEDRSISYTRSCNIRDFCEAGEADLARVSVDLRANPDGTMSPVAVLPAATTQRVMTLEDASRNYLEGLQHALSLQAQLGSEQVGINVATTPSTRFTGWDYYEISITVGRQVEQVLSYRLGAIGDFGCCTPEPPEPPVIVLPPEPEPPNAPIRLVYRESFEQGPNGWVFWTTDDLNGARTGEFSIGEPEQTYSRRDRVVVQPDHVPDGDRAVVSDPRAGSSVGQYDIDRGYINALSPEIEIPANARLSMDWFWGHASRWDGADSFVITVEAVETDEVQEVVGLTDTGVRAGEWENATLDLAGFAGLTVRIRVVASDVGAGSLSEAGFDNIVISAGPQIIGSTSTFWAEDFESAPAVVTNGDASTGMWNVGEPEATQWRGQALQQGAASSGKQALVTDSRAGFKAGAYDVDKGSTTATIDGIAIPVSFAPAEYKLSFDWYLAHLENARSSDGLTVAVVGETAKVVVLDERGTASYQSNQWQTASADITQFQGQTISIVITATDDAKYGALIEAGIDNMIITQTSYPGPLPLPPVTPVPLPPVTPVPLPPVLPPTPPFPGLPCTTDTTSWTRHEASRFTMLLPPGMVDQNPQGIDSEIGLFTDGVFGVSYDLGWYSNPLTSLDDEILPLPNGDVIGTLRFEAGQPNQLGVYYPDLDPTVVRPPNGPFLPNTKLNVVVSWDYPPNRFIAECIIGSITWR